MLDTKYNFCLLVMKAKALITCLSYLSIYRIKQNNYKMIPYRCLLMWSVYLLLIYQTTNASGESYDNSEGER